MKSTRNAPKAKSKKSQEGAQQSPQSKPLWRQAATKAFISAGNGLLVTASNKGMFEIGLTDGKKIWSAKPPRERYAPLTLIGPNVITRSSRGKVIALNLATGKLNREIPQSYQNTGHFRFFPVAISGHGSGCIDQSGHVMSADDWKPIYQVKVDKREGSHVEGAAGEYAFMKWRNGNDEELMGCYHVAKSHAKELWRIRIGYKHIGQAIAFYDDVVLFAGGKKTHAYSHRGEEHSGWSLTAISASNGKTLWRQLVDQDWSPRELHGVGEHVLRDGGNLCHLFHLNGYERKHETSKFFIQDAKTGKVTNEIDVGIAHGLFALRDGVAWMTQEIRFNKWRFSGVSLYEKTHRVRGFHLKGGKDVFSVFLKGYEANLLVENGVVVVQDMKNYSLAAYAYDASQRISKASEIIRAVKASEQREAMSEKYPTARSCVSILIIDQRDKKADAKKVKAILAEIHRQYGISNKTMPAHIISTAPKRADGVCDLDAVKSKNIKSPTFHGVECLDKAPDFDMYIGKLKNKILGKSVVAKITANYTGDPEVDFSDPVVLGFGDEYFADYPQEFGDRMHGNIVINFQLAVRLKPGYTLSDILESALAEKEMKCLISRVADLYGQKIDLQEIVATNYPSEKKVSVPIQELVRKRQIFQVGKNVFFGSGTIIG